MITRDRFDDFQKGDDRALTAIELQGADLFLNSGCTTCHNSPIMGGTSYQKVGLIHKYETPDKGRAAVTKDEDEEYKFKGTQPAEHRVDRPVFPQWQAHDAAGDGQADGTPPAGPAVH